MIDDRVPHPALGAGYPRACQVLQTLSKLGHKVWFLPSIVTETQREASPTLPERCKYIPQGGDEGIIRYVSSHPHRFDAIWISRPHNMALLARYLPEDHPVWTQYPLVIYDAEAIFALRTQKMREFYPQIRAGRPLSAELGLADTADAVVAVNDTEGQYFAKRGHRTFRLAAACEAKPGSTPFAERQGLLFVGSLREHPGPNADAIVWFCNEVVPRIQDGLTEKLVLTIAGDVMPHIKDQLASRGADVLGRVADLSTLYDRHRVFVAPHRFAAGIPYKIIEASAFGLPSVASSLLADQLGWRDRKGILTAQTGSASEFAKACITLYEQKGLWETLRRNAVAAVEHDFSAGQLQNALCELLKTKRA